MILWMKPDSSEDVYKFLDLYYILYVPSYR